eukprot:gene7979-1196_t
MDPKSKQEAKYKAKSMMRVFSDKMEVTGAKFSGGNFADIEVAVLKATLEDVVVPKEKHVRTLKQACAGGAPRQEVNCVIHNLVKRMETHKSDYLVTLKSLVTFHRLMREVDPTFQEELLKYSERTGTRRPLRLDGFADHTTKETWDLSAWIRTYSVYLDERLEAFRAFRFDPEATSDSKLKDCSPELLLERLPMVQKLLGRLIACVPQGSAQQNAVVVQAAEMVLKELRTTYKAVCEGIMNLADKFFEMERTDALRGLEAYKENSALNDRLNHFFSAINAIGSLRGSVEFPQLQALPPDFLTTLEDYVKEAPKSVDPSAPASTGGGARVVAPVALNTTASMARAGGATSAVITNAGGSSGNPPTIQAPFQGVLKVGGPAGSPTAFSPTAFAPTSPVDLLGADFNSMSMSAQQAQMQLYGQQQQQYGQQPTSPPGQYGVQQPPMQQQYGQQTPSPQGQYGQPPVQAQAHYGQPPPFQQQQSFNQAPAFQRQHSFNQPPAQQHSNPFNPPPMQQAPVQQQQPPLQQQQQSFNQPPAIYQQQTFNPPPVQQPPTQQPPQQQQQYAPPAAPQQQFQASPLQQAPVYQQAPAPQATQQWQQQQNSGQGYQQQPYAPAAAPAPAPAPQAQQARGFGDAAFDPFASISQAPAPAPARAAAPAPAPFDPFSSLAQPQASASPQQQPQQQYQPAAPAPAHYQPAAPQYQPAPTQAPPQYQPQYTPQYTPAPQQNYAASAAAPSGWAVKPSDPLKDLSFDVLGSKPAPPPKMSLKDMKQQPTPNLL